MNGLNFTIIFTHIPGQMKSRSNLQKISSFNKLQTYLSTSDSDSKQAQMFPESNLLSIKEKRKRNRKNNEIVKILIEEFHKHPYWNREFIRELSEKIGLSDSQIYKWNWDYKKKHLKEEGNYEVKLVCAECLRPSQLDSDTIVLQRFYKMSFETFVSSLQHFS